MTNIYGLTVVKNESKRYLKQFLEYHKDMFDSWIIIDDRSDDDTFKMCMDVGCPVSVFRRPESTSSFLENESSFRSYAWKLFESEAQPKVGDWIVALDADEFLIGDVEDLRDQPIEIPCLRIRVHEIFDQQNGVLMERVDGYWGKIFGSRIFRYREGGQFRKKAMGCGSEPTYVKPNSCKSTNMYSIVHLGYARDQDRLDKYNRYTSLLDHGHNDTHVQSIIKRPKLLECKHRLDFDVKE